MEELGSLLWVSRGWKQGVSFYLEALGKNLPSSSFRLWTEPISLPLLLEVPVLLPAVSRGHCLSLRDCHRPSFLLCGSSILKASNGTASWVLTRASDVLFSTSQRNSPILKGFSDKLGPPRSSPFKSSQSQWTNSFCCVRQQNHRSDRSPYSQVPQRHVTSWQHCHFLVPQGKFLFTPGH